MKVFGSLIEKKYVKTSKSAVVIFIILRLLIIFCTIIEFIHGNIINVLLSIAALILYTFPTLVQEKLKFEFPNTFEVVIYLFIFSSVVLGEINMFYIMIPYWDTILHLLSGFLCAGFGFSLFELCNKEKTSKDITIVFTVLVSFCFSITVGVIWEVVEYTADSIIRVDMQKGSIVKDIASIELNPVKDNSSLKINNIVETDIKTADGNEFIIYNGYLDVGLSDTMKDLILDMLGASIFCIFGIVYSINRDNNKKRFKFASLFIPKTNKNAN